MNLRSSGRGLVSLIAILLVLVAVIAVAAVGLGVVDIDQFTSEEGDSGDIERVSISGDQLVVQLAEDHEFDSLLIRHELDDPASERGVDFSLPDDGPISDQTLPRFGGNVSYELVGSPASPGLLCQASNSFLELETIEFPSDTFVVAGVEGPAAEKSEIETATIEIDTDEFACEE